MLIVTHALRGAVNSLSGPDDGARPAAVTARHFTDAVNELYLRPNGRRMTRVAAAVSFGRSARGDVYCRAGVKCRPVGHMVRSG